MLGTWHDRTDTATAVEEVVISAMNRTAIAATRAAIGRAGSSKRIADHSASNSSLRNPNASWLDATDRPRGPTADTASC